MSATTATATSSAALAIGPGTRCRSLRRCLQDLSACDRGVQHLGHLLATGQEATRAALALLHRGLTELEPRAD